MTKRGAFYLVVVELTLLALTGKVLAANSKLDQVQSDISSVTQKMLRIKAQRDDMQNLLSEVEQRYGETVAVLRTLQQQVDEKRESLEKIPVEVHKLEAEIQQCNNELADQVRAAYAVGQKGRLKLLLSQQDPALSSRIMMYYDYYNKSRLAKLAFVEESVKRLDLLSQQKTKDTELLEQTLAQKTVEQESLDRIRKERNALLLQLNNDFLSNEQRLAQLKESESSLKELVDSLDIEEDDLVFEGNDPAEDPENAESVENPTSSSDNSPPAHEDFSKVVGDFSALKGRLPLPVAGQVVSTFGSRRSQGISNGILIAADEGTDVYAVTQGKVAYAGNLQGYGLLMIVEHGKEFMTLYAFNQSLYKKRGDWVDAGEVIASVGQSGGRNQPGLYFEIRNKGKPVDPLVWCLTK